MDQFLLGRSSKVRGLMTPAIIGGILLMIGAFFVYRGEIYRSVMAYFLADFIWVSLAIAVGDYVGAIMIVIGGVLGFMAFLKMHRGEFNKTIKKK